jgi:hypothetical protein
MPGLSKAQKKQCLFCGTNFITRKRNQGFCTKTCRFRHYQDTHIAISLEEYTQYQRLKAMYTPVDSGEGR